jgi:hypothetical protein
MSGRTGESNTAEVTALLPVPNHRDMSDAQFKGTACVWCAITLSTETAFDLGQRRIRLLDGHITIFPRGCRTCTGEHANRTLQTHTQDCEQCVDDGRQCQTGMHLIRLIRGRR